MSETILVGRGECIVEVPRKDWEGELGDSPQLIKKRLEFMSPAHHAVRNFVVRMLPERGASSPLIVESRVVLPAPFEPTSATISPWCTSSSTSQST